MMNRRGFLRMLGLGAAAVAVAPLLPEEAELVEPRKKLWAVPSNAPVGSRIERYEFPIHLETESGHTFSTGDTAFALNAPGYSQYSDWTKAFKARYGKFIIPTREESIAGLEQLARAARGEIPKPVLIDEATYALWARS